MTKFAKIWLGAGLVILLSGIFAIVAGHTPTDAVTLRFAGYEVERPRAIVCVTNHTVLKAACVGSNFGWEFAPDEGISEWLAGNAGGKIYVWLPAKDSALPRTLRIQYWLEESRWRRFLASLRELLGIKTGPANGEPMESTLQLPPR